MGTNSILEYVEKRRTDLITELPADTKDLNGQFMTPESIAGFMASLFNSESKRVFHILDAGAGAGALTAALIDSALHIPSPPEKLYVTAYETDPLLLNELTRTAGVAIQASHQIKVPVAFEIIDDDFILEGSSQLSGDLFSLSAPQKQFTHAILNPPYKKISSKSQYRHALRRAGIETGNLYSAFIAIAIRMLCPGGELVAITPRSFCNGPYFRRFRQLVLDNGSFTNIHVFHSRVSAFSEEKVLQENIIFRFVKDAPPGDVVISSSTDRSFSDIERRVVDHSRVVSPDDKNRVIHIPVSEEDDRILEQIWMFRSFLEDLGLEISTGPVVDFRLREYLHDNPVDGCAPLVYPTHFNGQSVVWPKSESRKPNAILVHPKTKKWLMRDGHYVLTRRFSSKEEKRRIIPTLFEPLNSDSGLVGFENHLNVIHENGNPLDKQLAKGIVAYLGSYMIDRYFRQFSGHTQVNATDIRAIPFPSRSFLRSLSSAFSENGDVDQSRVDELLMQKVKA